MTTPLNFASDNVYGVHPNILAALAEANGATAASYGGDVLTRRAEERLREVFEGIDDPCWNGGNTTHPLMTDSAQFDPMRKITHRSERIV